MLSNYIPVLILTVIAVVFGCFTVGIGRILGPHHPTKAKLTAYECGFDPFGDARLKFDVRYYLVAILFIIFDLEIAFLFPWAVVLKDVNALGMGAMGLFLALLTVGFIYEWKKGALEWE